MTQRPLLSTSLVAILILTAGLLVSDPAVSEQVSTPIVGTPDTDVAAEIELRPAHIHAGTCDALGEVVYPLTDLQAVAQGAEPDATPMLGIGATPDAEDVLGPVEVAAQSATEVDVSVEDLLAGEYAINVHASAEDIETYLACGEVTGVPTSGELVIELRELNTSGFVGQARLADQGDGTTIVHMSLFPAEVDGTPIATPAG